MNKYFKLFEQHRLYDRLPSGFKIVKYDKKYRYTDDTYICIYITDSEYNILSSIEAVSIEDNYYVGGSASKLRGLGALAYEFTMMNIYPSGLMPNRDGDVREGAFNIWEKFYERNDLEKDNIPFSSSQYSIAIATGEDEPTTEEENREFYEESSTEYQKGLDTFNTAYKMKPNSIYESNIIDLDSLPIEIQDKIKEEEKMFFGNLYENKNLNNTIHNDKNVDRMKDLYLEYMNSTEENPHSLEPMKLNAGHCEDIAWYLEERSEFLDYDTNIIDDGFFWGSSESDYPCKSIDDYWQVHNMMAGYNSVPKFDLEELAKFDLTGHVWIYYKGKHYDVETMDGVESFWDLPIFQRQLKQLGII